jgi:hypothetical protein
MRPIPVAVSCLAAVAALALSAAPAQASFHLNEITKVMASYNGDATVQAVELKSLALGENLVAGDSINVYGPTGAFVASLGHFTSSVSNNAAGAHLLCATNAFQTKFGITADLTISPGIPAGTGQVAFKNVACLVNAVAYGDVVAPKDGTTSAPALLTGLANALVRTVDDGTIPSCPLGEDASAHFALRSGNTGAPIPFTNNAGATVNVFSTLTGVEGTAIAAQFRVGPNPAPGRLNIQVPGTGGLVQVFDARGALLRAWDFQDACCAGSALRALRWDGTDQAGRRAPSGIYFVRYRHAGLGMTRRIALLH